MPSFIEVVKSILGVSAFQPPGPGFGPLIDDDIVDRTRESVGGQIQPIVSTRLRWYLKDLERAQAEADNGFMRTPAQLCASMRGDGVYRGLINNRTASLVQLPKRFYTEGKTSKQMAKVLSSRAGGRSVYEEMIPPQEAKLMVKDGLELGVGIGELVPVKDRMYPVLVRLEPEFLQYRWVENRWYFQSVAGTIPITPGNGRWVMHSPGGRLTPWRAGIWAAAGRAYINKSHAMSYRANYAAKLANPARVAKAPLGATQAEREGFFRRIMAWATNTVIELPPGWEADILESNGRGWDVFQEEINTCDHEYMVAIEGQTMTTTGGEGFANGAIGENQTNTLTQEMAETWAYTINTQVLPHFGMLGWGPASLSDPCILELSAKKPADREKQARIMKEVGEAIKALNEAVTSYEIHVDAEEIFTQCEIPYSDGALEVAEENEEGEQQEGKTEKTENEEGGNKPPGSKEE